jgi:aarF domain-containing kinase
MAPALTLSIPSYLSPLPAGVSSVTIPRPIPGLVSSTVLVESFEAGQSVAVFMKEPQAINTQIVALGVDAYLKMLLTDNFVHTDLHPGKVQLQVDFRQHMRAA